MKTTILKSINIIVFSVFISGATAQNIHDIITDPNLNFFSIHQAIIAQKVPLLTDTVNNKSEIKRYYRWDWFWRSRIDQSGSFNTAGVKMVEYQTQFRATETTINPEINWKSVGPANLTTTMGMAGRVECLWVDPDDYQTIIIGTNTGGIFKTTNLGQHWALLTDQMMGGITSIVQNPTNKNELFIASGTYKNGYEQLNYSTGLWKTNNGGTSFTQCNAGLPSDEFYQVHSLIYHPTNTQILFAAVKNLVYKTGNGGTTWDLVLTSGEDNIITDIAIDPNTPDSVYATGKNAMYYSPDCGVNWLNMTKPPYFTTSNDCWADIDINQNHQLILFYRIGDRSTSNVLLKCNTGYSNPTYTEILGTGFVTTVGFVGDVYCDGTDFYWGCVRFFKFNAQNGRQPQTTVHDDIRDFKIFSKNGVRKLYVAHDGGISINETGADNGWYAINGDLAANQFYDVAIYDDNPGLFLAGSHDNGTFRANPNWSNIYWGDGGSCLIDYTNPSNQIWMSNLHVVGPYSLSFDACNYNPPFIQHPAYPYEIITGDWVLRRITNWVKQPGGFSWCPDPYWNTGGQAGRPISIKICNVAPYAMYWVLDGYNEMGFPFKPSVWKRPEALGSGNINITSNLPVKGGEMITDIEVASNNPNRLWVTFSGFSAADKVFFSENAGTNWTNISTGLPNLPATCIIYDVESESLICGNDVGMYKYNTLQAKWERYGSGFPYTPVSKLRVNKKTRELIVSTYGRGIWKSDLPCNNITTYQPITQNTTWNYENHICGDLYISNNAILTVNKKLMMSHEGKIVIEPGSTLVLEQGALLTGRNQEAWRGLLQIQSGAKLVLKNNAKISLAQTGKILAENVSNNPSIIEINTGASIILGDAATTFELYGRLSFLQNGTLTLSGNGYMKYAGSMLAASGSQFILIGNGQEQTLLKVACADMSISSQLSLFSVSNCKIEMVNNTARIVSSSAGPQFVFNQVKLTSSTGLQTQHQGLYVAYPSNLSITNCIFENGRFGVYLWSSNSGITLLFTGCQFNNNQTGVYISGSGINLQSCNFTGNTTGLRSVLMTTPSTISNTYFTNNTKGIYFSGNASASLRIEGTSISAGTNGQTGIETDGSYSLTMYCSSVTGHSLEGIKINNGTSVYLSTAISSQQGYVNLGNNKYGIYAVSAGNLNFNNGYNKFRPNTSITGAKALSGNVCGALTTTANKNEWNSLGIGPRNGTDYNLSNCRVPPGMLTISDGSPQVYQNCNGPGGMMLTGLNGGTNGAGNLPGGGNAFVQELATAVSYMELTNPSGNNSMAMTKLNTLIQKSNAWNNNNRPYTELAYDYMKMTLGDMAQKANQNMTTTVGIIALGKMMQANLRQTTRNLDDYSKLFILNIDKAQFLLLAEYFGQAIDILQEVQNWVSAADQDYLCWQICMAQAQQFITAGQMVPDSLDSFMANCSCDGSTLKSGIDDGKEFVFDMPIPDENLISIQPNPAHQTANIFVDVPEEAGYSELRIYNSAGVLVKQVVVKEGINRVEAGCPELISGIYNVVLICNGQKMESKKLIISE